MRFSRVEAMRIPKGSAKKIRHNGKVLWNGIHARYVSFGDSIAAGHTINSDWEKDYGTRSQYGENGNTETVIVPGCYTDLIRDALVARVDGTVSATSFARSGDRVEDLIEKLDHEAVRKALAKANYVTICIGANDVLEPALSSIESYINNGNPTLVALSEEVMGNLSILETDSNPNSYRALFNKLYEINPNATYVFTTIYNPLKYLWLDESTWGNDYKDGFFGPLMWAIPDFSALGFQVDNEIRKLLYNTSAVQTVFDRINGPSRNGTDGLAAWTETHINELNRVLKTKIAEFGKPNFMVADTKTLFENFPDRPVKAPKNYNDLVNIEFTSGYVVQDMDWGQFWANFSISDITGDTNTTMTKIMQNIVTNVIMPDIDPHPEEYGQYVLKRSFAKTFGIEELDRYNITYVANGGSGSMAVQEVACVDGIVKLNANTFTGAEGYRFTGWNTKADGSGTSYTNGQYIGLSGDLTLYAQWSNIYAVTYKHTNHTNLYGNDETGHMECYYLNINGEEMPKFGKFSEGSSVTYHLPYGTAIYVWVDDYVGNEATYNSKDCNVYLNGVSVHMGHPAYYVFNLAADTVIDFRWKIAGSLVTFDAQSWEDCHITTY